MCGCKFNNACGGCGSHGVDGFDNSIGSWLKDHVVNPITTAKNNAIQNITTAKNNAIQNVKQKGILRTEFGAAKNFLFGSKGAPSTPAQTSFDTGAPQTSTDAQLLAAQNAQPGISTGTILAIVASVSILALGTVALIKYTRKNKKGSAPAAK